MELRETSGNFEVDHLQHFLQRVKTLVDSGFGENEILQIQTAAEVCPLTPANTGSFQLTSRGPPHPSGLRSSWTRPNFRK